MILPNLSLLIHAYNRQSRVHAEAKLWWEELAALAIERQCELHTTDGDFSRFPGLRWRNPLAD